MSATSTAPATAELRGRRLSGLTFGGVLKSEWIKLTTLRSTIWCYAIMFGLIPALTALVGALAGNLPATGPDGRDAAALQVVTVGIAFAQLVVAVLGTLFITGEYGTGMIRSTLTAVPRRTPALLAKALVFAATTFVLSLVALLLSVLLAVLLLPGAGIHPDFTRPTLFLPVLGGALYLALLGVLSLAFGFVVRNSAAGISVVLGLLLVVPTILQIFGVILRQAWPFTVTSVLPSSLGTFMHSVGAQPQVVPGVYQPDSGIATLLMLAWVVVPLIAGLLLLKRRDA